MYADHGFVCHLLQVKKSVRDTIIDMEDFMPKMLLVEGSEHIRINTAPKYN